MPRAFALALAVSGLVAAAPAAPERKSAPAADVWAPLRPILGTWVGTNRGRPGNGTVRRTYRLALGDRFIEVHNRSTYPPQERNPKGEVHEDAGYLSFDGGRKVFVLRQFHVEGFVNTYAGAPPEGGDLRKAPLVLSSEAIENIAPGWRARETWRLEGDALVEVFELAAPGEDYEVYVESRLHRAPAP